MEGCLDAITVRLDGPVGAAEAAVPALRPSTDEPEDLDGESRFRVPPAARLCGRRGIPLPEPVGPSVGEEPPGAALVAATPRTLLERDIGGIVVAGSEWLRLAAAPALGVAAFAGLVMPFRERVVAMGTDCGVGVDIKSAVW